MNATQLQIEQGHVHKLLCAGSGDAALLYLYIQSGNDPEKASQELGINESRYSCAAATLRQLGLWPQERAKVLLVGERPRYSEVDVIRAMDHDTDFRALYAEIQRLLGKSLSTEEIKILLGFVRYLGMPMDVICVLVCYCKDRTRRKGSHRNPSLRSIEKEAYAWAELGIDTMEEAAAYIQQQNVRASRISQIMAVLQIHGRKLTPGEENYAKAWIDWGFTDAVIAMAYERTCLNTGGLSWPYLNKILNRWYTEGLMTPEQIAAGDQKKTKKVKTGQREFDDDEKAALIAMMKEE